MISKITRIIELSYFELLAVFFIIVLLGEFNIVPLQINYIVFIFVLVLLAIPLLLKFTPSEDTRLSVSSFIVPIVFLITLVFRLLPVFQLQIPLGYDPGFYKYTIDVYANALPQIPEAALATWVREMHSQGLFVFTDVVKIFMGLDSLDILKYLFPFLGAMLVFPVYSVTRHLFGQKTGLIASILYAFSYTQYTTFTLLYFKNVLGLMFLLLAIYALEKKRYGLMSLMFAALGIFHYPEFLLFALILAVYFIINRKLKILFAVLGTAIMIAPFWIPRFDIIWGMLTGVINTAMINIQTGEALGSGSFFSLEYYIIISIAYVPFALMSAFSLVKMKRWNSILLYFLISSIIVIFQLIFFKRFIIQLDIAVIILAAAGITYTILPALDKTRVWRAAGICMILLLLVTSAIPTIKYVREARPLINEAQLQAIDWIKNNTEDDAYVLATDIDAPWVLAWSGRKVIAPGLFEWDVHNKNEWFGFFDTTQPETAEDFLSVYDDTIYIYFAKNEGNYIGLDKFEGGSFINVYDDDSAVVYKYPGGN